MNKRLLIVFLLGFSSGLPLALISSTLQAWYAEAGLSVVATSFLSLLSLPYAYRPLWGPILDRYSLGSLGKRRSWILSAQITLLLGFNIMAWFSPSKSPELMAVIAFMIACASSIQDTAIDAHRVEYLPASKHGLGASLAVLGYRFALLISGGLALVFVKYLGWVLTYRLMGMLMLVGVGATLYTSEPSMPTKKSLSFTKIFTEPVKEFLARPRLVSLLCFILFYKLGEAFTTTTSGVVMPFLIQGLGFSLDTIGYVNKVMGFGALILGGLIAGFFLLRWSLYRALFIFGLLQAFTNLLFVALAAMGRNTIMLAVAVGCDNFAAGMGSTAMVALLMRLTKQPFTATQFSLLVSLTTLPHILSGPIAVPIQAWFGWTGLYQLSFLLALGFIPFLVKIREQVNVPAETELDFESDERATV